MFGRMHWWWLVLGMVLLGLVVSLVIIFTKDRPPYQKATFKQQSVAEELRSDTAASITAVNETYVQAWRPDTLCSFNGAIMHLFPHPLLSSSVPLCFYSGAIMHLFPQPYTPGSLAPLLLQ